MVTALSGFERPCHRKQHVLQFDGESHLALRSLAGLLFAIWPATFKYHSSESRPPGLDFGDYVSSSRAPRLSSKRVGPQMTVGDPSHSLLHWVRNQGGHVGPVSIGRSRLGGGNGCFLTRGVKQDEILFTVPVHACIGLSDCLDDPICGSTFRQLVGDLKTYRKNFFCLAAYLAKVKLCDDLTPYLSMLPWAPGEQDHILWWSDDDIAELGDSLAFEEAKAMRKSVDEECEMFGNLLSHVPFRKNESQSVDEDRRVIDKTLRAAIIFIMSRVFVMSDDENDLLLIPLLDVIQHGAEPTVSHERGHFEDGVESFVIRARKNLTEGTELVNWYGGFPDMPLHRYLTRYGFVPGLNKSIREIAASRDPLLFADTFDHVRRR